MESWLTGRRLVSLPFSDYCQPLVDDTHDLNLLMKALDPERHRGGWRYVELRPCEEIETPEPVYHVSSTYFRHEINLNPSHGVVQKFSQEFDSTQNTGEAEREKLDYREGTSGADLDAFYRLLVLTRRRHSVHPQPEVSFRNLLDTGTR